jgi:putative transposase
MRDHTYPSDVTDAQWALIEPLIPVYIPVVDPAKPTCGMSSTPSSICTPTVRGVTCPRTSRHAARYGVNLDPWRRHGTLDIIPDRLRTQCRTPENPYQPRTTASVGRQSVDTTSGGESHGRDNAQNGAGRKRHIVVDSMGLLLAVLVTAADVDEAQAAAEVFARLEGQPLSKVERMFADNKYHNQALYPWVDENACWKLVLVRRPVGAVGWVQLPIRWMVQRTFAWLGKCRRWSKDRERTVLLAEAFIKLARINFMLNRLEPQMNAPEFMYRPAT